MAIGATSVSMVRQAWQRSFFSSVSRATSIGNDTAADDTVDGVVVVAVVVLSFLAVFFVRAMSSCQLRNVK